MKTFNQVLLAGNLAEDPKVKKLDEGIQLAEMVVVTNRNAIKDGEKTEVGDFHKVVVWRKLAELCGQYLKKGSSILLNGKLVYTTFTNKEGKKVKKTEIHADDVTFLKGKGVES